MGKNKIVRWGPAILFFGILLAVFLDQFGLFGKNTVSLTVTNHTPTDISEIVVVLYKDPCVIQRLTPGKSSVCSFEIEADSHYKISWKESDVNSHMEEVGYVTHGFNFKHELEFLGEGKVNFKNNENT